MTKIQLNQQHIDKAIMVREDAHKLAIHKSCPVAIALTEHFDRPCWVGMREFGYLDEKKVFQLPKNVSVIIDSYDFKQYDKIKPMEFEVELRD